jgi:molybdopterin converting factor small subunit
MASWEVSLFAYLRERHGASVTVEAESTVASVLQALADAGIQTMSCRVAVNDEFALPGDALTSGSKVALIPPVSGG